MSRGANCLAPGSLSPANSHGACISPSSSAKALIQARISTTSQSSAGVPGTDVSPDTVVHRVGYTNVNSFRRMFKGHFGLSPTEYAARYRAP